MKLRRLALFPLPLLAAPLLAGCSARSSLSESACDPGAGPGDIPTCVAADADDACGPAHLVPAACDGATHTFRCPEGAWPYARAAETPTACLPLTGLQTTNQQLGSWGLGGSLVRVPTDDGRCLWIADQIQAPGGADPVRNAAFEVDRRAPFGSCPTTASIVGGTPTSVVTMEGAADPTILVQIASAFRFAGVTRVAYRLFQLDPTATFGVTDLGGGLGRWDPVSQRIVVQGPDAITFPTTLDLGNAALSQPDHAYLWGCPRPGAFLASACILARFDAADTMQLLTGAGTWATSTDGSLAATTTLQSGPWVSSVVPDPGSGGLLHVFTIDFGRTLETETAPTPSSPWTSTAPLGACVLPPEDSAAYCAGPVVHEELADPTRPGEVVVSYGIGSTAANQAALMSADPEGYWTHLSWSTAP